MIATDKDKGVNANITYSITPGSNPDGDFKINPFTGTLSLAKKLSGQVIL